MLHYHQLRPGIMEDDLIACFTATGYNIGSQYCHNNSYNISLTVAFAIYKFF